MGVDVSDHAVLRYLERVEGVDVAAVRRRIAAAVRISERHEGVSGVLHGGLRYKIRDGVVVTVLFSSQPDLRHGRQRRERDGGEP